MSRPDASRDVLDAGGAGPGDLDPFLPGTWVHRIWSTMRGNYGAAFDRLWQCPESGDEVAHVKSLRDTWQRELRNFRNFPEAITYGLENLPPHPLSLPEFRALCLRAPARAPKQQDLLPPPKADLGRLASELQRVAGAWKARKATACLEDLEQRQRAGERLTAGQLAFVKAAREARPATVVQYGEFRPIDPDCLPPGMVRDFGR